MNTFGCSEQLGFTLVDGHAEEVMTQGFGTGGADDEAAGGLVETEQLEYYTYPLVGELLEGTTLFDAVNVEMVETVFLTFVNEFVGVPGKEVHAAFGLYILLVLLFVELLLACTGGGIKLP